MKFIKYIAFVFDGGDEDALLNALEDPIQDKYPGLAIEPIDGGTLGQCESVDGPSSELCAEIRDTINAMQLAG